MLMPANWAGWPDTRSSTTGQCMFLSTCPISWECKNQTTVPKSFADAEYQSLSSACSEVIWLRHLQHEFGVFLTGSTPFYADNVSSIKIATNPVFHKQTKHMEVDYQFICQNVSSEAIHLLHVSDQNSPRFSY